MILSPLAKQFFLDNNGNPVAGGRVFTYVAGTTTKIATYKDSAGTLNTNPIVLDYRGECDLWIDPTLSYKYVLAPPGSDDPPTNTIWTVDNVSFGLTASVIGQILYPRSAIEIAAGVTPVAYQFQYGHAWRYGANPDGVTETSGTLNTWLSCGYKILYLPVGTYLSGSTLTIRLRSYIYGDGPRMSVIRHTSSATGPLLKVETGKPPVGPYVDDITEGAVELRRFGVQPRNLAGCYGFEAIACLNNMFSTVQFRIQNQLSETFGAAPYPSTANTRGMNIDGGTGALMSHHDNLEIRACSEAMYLRNVTNEWHVHGWFVDCKGGFDVNGVSLLRSFVTHESSVADAYAWNLSGNVANIVGTKERWELPQGNSYGVQMDNAGSYANIEFNMPLVLINLDGFAWPGRKYLASDGVRGGANGTLQNGIIFKVMMGNSVLTIGSAATEHQFSPSARVGGTNIGNGIITIGRNAGGADNLLKHDGTNFQVIAGNNLNLSGDATTSTKVQVNSTGVAFQGTTAIAKPTITGAKAGNAAVASIATQGAAYGLWVDGTT